MKRKNLKYPFVSVVIPAINEENFIAATLKSLKRQDYPGKYEIIVVDNASQDKTAEIAKSYGAKVIYQPIKGLRFTREKGFSSAKGQFIASTDADITLPKNWLTRMAQELILNDDLVAVSGWFKLQKGPIIPRVLINRFSAPTLFLYRVVFGKSLLLDQNFMVRRDAYLKAGGFAGLDSMNEDLLLAQRLAKIGKVKMHYGKSWSVTSSPRRWMDGFIPGAYRYLTNAVTFGLFGKLVFKDFVDVRREKASSLRLKTQLAYVLGAITFTASFLLVPTSPIHAKTLQIEKRFTSSINKSFNRVRYHHLKATPSVINGTQR